LNRDAEGGGGFRVSGAGRRIDRPLEDFPGRRVVRRFEGGSVSVAERDARFYVLLNEGSMAGLLDDEDLGSLAHDLVKVIEFETEAARSAYLRSRGWVRDPD
jgi:hypothetical protein